MNIERALAMLMLLSEQITFQPTSLEISQYCSNPHYLVDDHHLDIAITTNASIVSFGRWTVLEDGSGRRVLIDYTPPDTPYRDSIYHGSASSITNDKSQPAIEFEGGQYYKFSLNKAFSKDDIFLPNPPLDERLAYTEFVTSLCGQEVTELE